MDSRTLILNRLQRLVCLNLEGAPADDVFPGTVKVWVGVLGDYSPERLSVAFDAVEKSATRWPSPATVIASLPQYVASFTKRLAPPGDEESRKRVRTMLDALAIKLGETP